jgi:fermentation-respiration switch protein FrsA (DUF1100 family)
MIRALVIPIVLIGVVLLLFWAGQRRMIYYPFGDVPSPGQVGLLRAQQVTFTTDDGVRLNGWFVPAMTAPAAGAVIVFNGNAGNRSFRADLARYFSNHGYATLLFDYRGYGGNPGVPSEDGLRRDAIAARRFVDSRPEVDRRRIVYFGESLGAAVAIGLALDHRPQVLVLRSPFTSLADAGRYHFPYLPVSLLLRDRYPSIDRITRVSCPVLVVAGDRDTIVPTEQSRRLFDRAVEPKRLIIVKDNDHNDAELNAGPTMLSGVVEFIELATGAKS